MVGGVIQDITDGLGLTNFDEQQDKANADAAARQKAIERAKRDAEARRKRALAATRKLKEEQRIAKERAAKQKAAERSAAQEQDNQAKRVASGGKMGLLNFASQNNASLGQLLTTLG